jgi:hypothetical protein
MAPHNKLSEQIKEKFFSEGNQLPICVNDGCDKNVLVREWKNWSFKSECSRCTTARKEKRYNERDGMKYITYRGKEIGVTIHKKTYCENIDEKLGFVCPVPRDGWVGFQNSLDLDHLDGNHYNNVPGNVKTFCKLCHGRKSLENGDCNSNKSSARNIG